MEEAVCWYGKQEIQRNSIRRKVVRGADREKSQDKGSEEDFREAKAAEEEHRRQEEWEEETILYNSDHFDLNEEDDDEGPSEAANGRTHQKRFAAL